MRPWMSPGFEPNRKGSIHPCKTEKAASICKWQKSIELRADNAENLIEFLQER